MRIVFVAENASALLYKTHAAVTPYRCCEGALYVFTAFALARYFVDVPDQIIRQVDVYAHGVCLQRVL
ncbi:MAG: hypothetical protein ABIU97_11240 [Dehalococcoidia bacterium]